MQTSLMKGKRGLVVGVANRSSIAWAIAKACVNNGAEVALTFQNETLEKRVRPLAQELDCNIIAELDVSNPQNLAETAAFIRSKWDSLDFIVHAVAYADRSCLMGRFIDTTQVAFQESLAISCYSLTALCREFESMFTNGGSVLTLTYYGAEKIMPHYNLMGVAKAALEASVRYLAEDLGKSNIRVNAISAGPIKTLAASGIGDFRYILKWNAYNSPLRRNVTADEVGGAALYLLSDLGSAVTGEVHHVDCGYHVIGMKAVDAPDIATV